MGDKTFEILEEKRQTLRPAGEHDPGEIVMVWDDVMLLVFEALAVEAEETEAALEHVAAVTPGQEGWNEETWALLQRAEAAEERVRELEAESGSEFSSSDERCPDCNQVMDFAHIDGEDLVWCTACGEYLT